MVALGLLDKGLYIGIFVIVLVLVQKVDLILILPL